IVWLHRDALTQRICGFFEGSVFHVGFPQSEPRDFVIRIDRHHFLERFDSWVGHALLRRWTIPAPNARCLCRILRATFAHTVQRSARLVRASLITAPAEAAGCKVRSSAQEGMDHGDDRPRLSPCLSRARHGGRSSGISEPPPGNHAAARTDWYRRSADEN